MLHKAETATHKLAAVCALASGLDVPAHKIVAALEKFDLTVEPRLTPRSE